MDGLQILQLIANIAQVLGVIWLLFFGGKAIIDVVRDISRHQPIRKVSAATITNVLLALILLALISLRFFPIANSTSAPTSASSKETLTVPFVVGITSVPTKKSYKGTVTIEVSGWGYASGTQKSDAFYIFTDTSGNDMVPQHTRNFSLWINGRPVDDFIDPIPPYNPNHTYMFQMIAPGGSLTFGICDNGASDNSGFFTVTLS